jgi:hypothetical protein
LQFTNVRNCVKSLPSYAKQSGLMQTLRIIAISNLE